MQNFQNQPYPNLDYEAARTRIKAEVSANVRLNEFQARQQLKEAADERKRHIGEMLLLTEEGEIQIVTTNLSVDAVPRWCINMKKPKLSMLYTNTGLERFYRLKCVVSDKEKQVFLDEELIGDGTYVLKKLAAGGIYFCLEKAKAKRFAVELFAILRQNLQEEIFIPDGEAWVKNADGTYRFVDAKEVLTWEYVKRLAE